MRRLHRVLFALSIVLAPCTAFSETQQRIDFGISTGGLFTDRTDTNAELFTSNSEDNSQELPIFWVKVAQTVRSVSNAQVKSEIISIREFPTIEYRKVLRQLRSVGNLDSP